MLLSNKNKEEAFIIVGFSNWNNATQPEKGFTQNESSNTHKDAFSRFLKIQKETKNLIERVLTTFKLLQNQNRKNLIKINSSMR